ncbi:hypothetical protein BS47DRAFT_1344700 [Hydnum rufescens UP504]|uniref:Glutamine amidotransferase type-2 domain-containing protein n=1 Tax=Hydnum rufescens UP504 TaxID=1448309 RepID=A0A9P6AW50_9AGAM|nr:hypothetical protein BS47DRAFT_1344700 [Hydnum rufescens UP504]
MCRVVAVKSTTPIQLAHLLTRPRHSIINQALDSRLRLDLRRPINGDGFGVGWYDSVVDEELGHQPCLFKSITPAWNNSDLNRIAEKTKSPLVFGHVRATTAGSLSQDNCHPWSYEKIMFMHDGGIAESDKIKRKLQASLSDELFLVPQGNTDSEWVFALYLSKLPDVRAREFSPAVLRDAPSLLNFFVTEGSTIVASRYISSKYDEAASLYFSSGTTFSEYAPGGHYRMSKSDKRENIIMVASEPLTFEKADWMEIKMNTLIDEFSASSKSKRTAEFAAEKGLWTQNPRRTPGSHHGSFSVSPTISDPEVIPI